MEATRRTWPNVEKKLMIVPSVVVELMPPTYKWNSRGGRLGLSNGFAGTGAVTQFAPNSSFLYLYAEPSDLSLSLSHVMQKMYRRFC